MFHPCWWVFEWTSSWVIQNSCRIERLTFPTHRRSQFLWNVGMTHRISLRKIQNDVHKIADVKYVNIDYIYHYHILLHTYIYIYISLQYYIYSIYISIYYTYTNKRLRMLSFFMLKPSCLELHIQHFWWTCVTIGATKKKKTALRNPWNPGCLIGILTMVCYNPHITG